MKIEINSKSIKAQAKLLKDFVNEKYPDFKLSNAYQAISIMYGFKDWNFLSAYLKTIKDSE
jgi:Glyoxalase superfamily protein